MSDSVLRRLEVVSREDHDLEMPIRSPDQVVRFLRERHAMDMQESFWVVPLDGRHRPIGYVRVSQGTLAASLVHPREVFCIAIREAAAAVVLIHNHPSGDASPSAEDRTVTKRITNVGEMVGIRVLDHLIISKGGYYSFKENNPDFLEADGVK